MYAEKSPTITIQEKSAQRERFTGVGSAIFGLETQATQKFEIGSLIFDVETIKPLASVHLSANKNEEKEEDEIHSLDLARISIAKDEKVTIGPKLTGSQLSKESYDNSWNEMFQQLVLFQKEHGNTFVPQIYIPHRKLGNWVHTQRKQYSKFSRGASLFDKGRIIKMESIGFEWVSKRGGNNCSKQCLTDHIGAEMGGSSNAKPVCDVKTIKTRRDKKSLTIAPLIKRETRSEDSTELECSAKIHDSDWLTHYNALKEFKRDNGHCLVSRDYSCKLNPPLGRWVNRQRKMYDLKKMEPKHIQLLNEIEFSSKMMCHIRLSGGTDEVKKARTSKNFVSSTSSVYHGEKKKSQNRVETLAEESKKLSKKSKNDKKW
eukprot:CAMPEP_0194371844 /NCGR_PEP_ID=MMETSP0174-20130528/20218_1 /TAXON_ID=216777 /ORGANISM="Proboscia alata, Strain PI-D3" /LENGTH=373 /DNA_ID=CAMNT_0039150081 /DNA_START=348 /DNA_END=1466 /DNA_ORIENTATION=-